MEPTAAALLRRADEIVGALLLENEPRWRSLSPADRRRVELMAYEVAARLFGEAASRMERAPAAQARAVADLFALDQSPSGGRRTRVSV